MKNDEDFYKHAIHWQGCSLLYTHNNNNYCWYWNKVLQPPQLNIDTVVKISLHIWKWHLLRPSLQLLSLVIMVDNTVRTVHYHCTVQATYMYNAVMHHRVAAHPYFLNPWTFLRLMSCHLRSVFHAQNCNDNGDDPSEWIIKKAKQSVYQRILFLSHKHYTGSQPRTTKPTRKCLHVLWVACTV